MPLPLMLPLIWQPLWVDVGDACVAVADAATGPGFLCIAGGIKRCIIGYYVG